MVVSVEIECKTLDDYFADWEGHVFGFGYGSGEEHILAALKRFVDLTPASGAYDHRVLERELTPTVAWLLINALCHADILEYGTEPILPSLMTSSVNLASLDHHLSSIGWTRDKMVAVLGGPVTAGLIFFAR